MQSSMKYTFYITGKTRNGENQFDDFGECIGPSNDIAQPLFQRWGIPFDYKKVFSLMMVPPKLP